ncbi:CATRA system-associated protein [Actinacidiphila acididurans]|uniref:CATRA-Associated Small Protein domain-containing protein n=1 Tax=Actinacidiphila acididurans TaxID=2784346 RepID=A0ABS2TZ88_9ACTN|nr:CATRA system-associated protein [Actinacidiphila acididurans]MBM9507821.1 hypothetical protein [Actinacidiphila acididurans]
MAAQVPGAPGGPGWPRGPGGPRGDDVAWRALASLRRVPGWRLTGRQWTAVTTAVAEVAAAWQARDPRRLRIAVARLELAGPRLVVTRHEDEPLLPAPAELPERLNVLVTSIVAEAGEPPAAPPGEGAEGADR